MTQAFNLSQLANKVNSSGELDLATGVTGTLPVNEGGTGQTTYTNGQVLIGNSTGNTLTKTTLTAGTGISVTNGAGSIIIANTLASGFTNMQVFNSPGTFTTPATTTKMRITVVGAGAAGGNTNPGITPVGGNGGGAGGASIYVGPVNASTPYPVTVGTGGTAPGGAGGTSSFGALASATGGGPATAAGIGSGGTLNISGGVGENGGSGIPAGMGGVSIFSANRTSNATQGAFGAGGRGASPAGITGGAGVVIVEW